MRSIFILLLLLGMVACGSARPRDTATPTDRNVVTGEAIMETRVATAFEALERLRPEFLRARGPFSMRSPGAGLPVVYVDNVRAGDINQLRSIPASSVSLIEFISAADATTRWGTGHAGGALLVHTRR